MKFGQAVAFDENWVIVGAPASAEVGPGVGAVHVYKRKGATLTRHGVLSSGLASDGATIGMSVALSGNQLAVATRCLAGACSPSVQIWTLMGDEWQPQDQPITLPPIAVVPTDPAMGVSFDAKTVVITLGHQVAYIYNRGVSGGTFKAIDTPGIAASLSGSRVAITKAPGSIDIYQSDAIGSGATWAKETSLGSPVNLGATCGQTLALQGTWLLVGCPAGDGVASSVRFINLAQGNDTTTLSAPSGVDLGPALGIDDSGTKAVALEQEGTTLRAHFFKLEGSWKSDVLLDLPATAPFDGSTLAVRSDGVLVGLPHETSVSQPDAGAVQLLTIGSPAPALGPRLEPLIHVDSDFGHAVAIDANTMVVGLPRAEGRDAFGTVEPLQYTAIPGAGRVALYRRSSTSSPWQHAQWLWAPDPQPDGHFGTAVALRGDKLFVGAPGAGSVSVFSPDKDGAWQHVHTLTGAPQEEFGAALSFDGATLAVGAPRLLLAATGQEVGKVALYKATTKEDLMGQPFPLLGSIAKGRFGGALAIEGSSLVVGVPYDSTNGDVAGSATLFNLQGTLWTPTKVYGATPGANRYFGLSVALQDGAVLVGGPGNGGVLGNVSGYNTKGTPTDPPTLGPDGTFFGHQLAIDQKLALVGSKIGGTRRFHPWWNVSISASPKWEESASDLGMISQPLDTFGDAVALQVDTIDLVTSTFVAVAAVGAPGDDLVTVWGFAQKDGQLCVAAPGCLSGFCVDGVCCNSECGGGNADDCQACSKQAGGDQDGTCSTRHQPDKSLPQCQPAGVCTLAASCQEGSLLCPEPQAAPEGTKCSDGETEGTCDLAQNCLTGGAGGEGGKSGNSGQGGEAGEGGTAGAGTAGLGGAGQGPSLPDLWVGLEGGTTAAAGTTAGSQGNPGGQGGDPSVGRPPRPNEAVAASEDEGCSYRPTSTPAGSSAPGALLVALLALASRRRRAA